MIIGLTGGIGSGKSTVCRYLADKGYPVIDADKIAREIVEPGTPALKELSVVFGADIITERGDLDRKKLAGIVFTDKAKKESMEKIMHGEILSVMKKRVQDRLESGYKGLIILDIPLLFETNAGFVDEIDEIWLVDAEEGVRTSRIIKRDGISREEVLMRMKNQMSSEEKRKRAHVIIDNSGKEEELYRELDKLIKKYED